MNEHFQDTIRARLTTDSTFQIPLQVFADYDNKPLSIVGNGRVANDSIFMYYDAGGAIGEFQCKCKGVKKSFQIIYENDYELKIKICPNPVDDILRIETANSPTDNKQVKLLIYNPKGNLVLQKKIYFSHKVFIDLSCINKGIYFLYIKDGNILKYVQPFIKK